MEFNDEKFVFFASFNWFFSEIIEMKIKKFEMEIEIEKM